TQENAAQRTTSLADTSRAAARVRAGRGAGTPGGRPSPPPPAARRPPTAGRFVAVCPGAGK
ncbi:hypothetical protein, partial [Streptomyces lasiicapitis]|uniref:hypothetical protein n=1 Tax=Streptomyces lasiicapitis TaxID=1923961 RepID=UPI00368AD11B